MKKVKIIALVLAVVLTIVLANSFYTVRENEYACVVRFAKIIR